MLADINGNLADLRSEAMASQRFCLRWNNHQSNLLSVFDQLLHDESFVDVTLAVEGQLLRAHKMVLSACSPYFQALFVGHPDKHPIVILKDVPYVDMRSLLDFMYRGEVSVDQDRLTAFLRVAESLRIKGLTEVNEDKCDLPSITSSLLGNQNTIPPPPPNLHRINQIGPHHHVSQKRFHHMSNHPLLGSALTAPKRKRGRPRKLSGSSDTPIGEASTGQDLQSCSSTDLVQGSPEMMEMKMGIDFQSETTGNNRSGSSTGSNNVNSNNIGNSASASANLAASSLSSARKDEPTENGTETHESLTPRVKREPEPTPSTSAQASEETFARPHSRQGSESFKQEFSSSTPNKSETITETWKEKTRMASSHGSASGNNSASQTADGFSSGRNGERGASGLSIGSMGMTTTTGTTSSAIMTTTTNTTMATSTSSTSSTSTSSSTTSTTGPSPMDTSAGGPAAPSTPITRGSSSSSSSSPASARSAQSNNNNNSHNNNNNSSNNNNNNNSSTPLSTTNSSSSGGQQSGPAIGTMSAPTGRQVPKRRMRRRATSHSQDPAEQLTEMSVRGLNLFRYASISEGVYQCTECAKLDIQKTFKNKYSFQRHAFLYHEGHQRKVFPCPVCSKEFSRPDKMKNHMKTVHDCFMPKDCVMPFGFFLPP
ncbi:protein tramtrack, alpha isoform isoform X1 [Vespula pensylvanica]|uniref:protein tramtrack, alpha isoform isoform X1 n=1 Tax=Vespula pensylvanica TaxID=30213 RepID=UPI001CBA2ABB|nr:protein tramtrack, alpha isoform isoform X1 [Vespula pensylvanica]XP_043671079.1 protein tramtrack, alpha isoform isoform X1 [Vespula pensylvanica]XP_043671080.1 protein tramtrack, alpha isoform isoform X1 [Vespula pensylvanica]XP_043671081.1 protein tramtrack, alpha isoform isoform X1 [Vespula pensylvanica]XP_043671082.1 protein tramtrack, alpha isoform isoform X1 [Vespula pensylvanica]XP_050853179.1 protein tramtrack, alpha isoform isoform X1 [Vespula vulgaris]XP_050853180.1 protein tram